MSGLSLSAKHILAIVFAFSVAHATFAEPDIEGFGLRAEAVYWFGHKHMKQDRWATNFAVANSAQLIRHANPMTNRHRSHIDDLNYDPVVAAFQDRSPFAIQFNITASGDYTTMLWGVPVAAKISPLRSADGQGSSWVAKPWVWVGALAVGGALASGGGGSSGSDGSNADSGTTVVGGDECNIVSADDSGPSVISGCGVLGTEVNAP